MLLFTFMVGGLCEPPSTEAGVKSELLDTVQARKLAYYGPTMRKQGSCLEKEIKQGTMPGARKRGNGLNGQHQDVDRTAV